MSFDPDRVVPTQDQRNVQLLVNAGRRIRAPEPTVAVGPGTRSRAWVPRAGVVDIVSLAVGVVSLALSLLLR